MKWTVRLEERIYAEEAKKRSLNLFWSQCLGCHSCLRHLVIAFSRAFGLSQQSQQSSLLVYRVVTWMAWLSVAVQS